MPRSLKIYSSKSGCEQKRERYWKHLEICSRKFPLVAEESARIVAGGRAGSQHWPCLSGSLENSHLKGWQRVMGKSVDFGHKQPKFKSWL